MSKYILFFILFSLNLFAGDEVKLGPNFFKELDLESLPSVKKYSLDELGSKISLFSNYERFTARLNALYSYGEDKSRQLSKFVPVTSPTSMTKIGISKASRLGYQLNAGVVADQFSNNFLTKGTTVGMELSFTMDLFKDLLGRNTNQHLLNLEDTIRLKALEKEVFVENMRINLLKIYWSLVANNESINITQKLIQQAEKQVNVTSRKLKNAVSDIGTLARVKSILSSRKGSLNSLHYQRSNLHRSLRELLPDLKGKPLSLESYDINKTVKKLFTCTKSLEELSSASMEHTHLDEISKIQHGISTREKKLADSHDQIDLKLVVNSKLIGKDFSYSNAYDDFLNNPKPVNQISIQFNAPIGSTPKNTEKLLKLLAKRKGEIANDEINSKIDAFHLEILNSVKILKEAMRNQKENTMALKESLLSGRQKFAQARISIEQLVNQEDAYFASELNSIQTNLSILHTLLDYFSVFPQTNCTLNLQTKKI